MTKKISLFFAVLLLILPCSFSVCAEQTGNVYDDASLLTDSEIGDLNEMIDGLGEESGWNVYAVTTEYAEGKSAMAYADDFFDTHSPQQEDGLVALIDMDNREIWISTCGEAVYYLTDQRMDDILDRAFDDVSEGEYAACFETMIEGVSECYRMGIPGDQYTYDMETGEVTRYRNYGWSMGEILIAIAAALAAGGILFGSVVGRYRLKFGTYKYAFRDNSTVLLRVQEDRFVNQTVTHRRIPRQSSSGGSSSGRSTVHRSSSGRSHGGGGRKF